MTQGHPLGKTKQTSQLLAYFSHKKQDRTRMSLHRHPHMTPPNPTERVFMGALTSHDTTWPDPNKFTWAPTHDRKKGTRESQANELDERAQNRPWVTS